MNISADAKEPHRMNIIIVHNAYLNRGGEDIVVEAEYEMLARAGHNVHLEIVTNGEITSLARRINAFIDAPYSNERRNWMRQLVLAHKANLVHVHNFFPLLTPSIYDGAKDAGAAVVQTLHNYRTVCGNALLLRNGAICEKCLKGSKLWGVIHKCYRNSTAASLAVARMQMRANFNNAWDNVDRFISLSNFLKDKLTKGGLPASKISVKPNFTTRDSGDHSALQRRDFLFVGRLSKEKGVDLLVQEWNGIPDLTLNIVGDGPEARSLRENAPPNVHFLGALSQKEVRALMRSSRALIVPSIWHEPFGMVAIEALAEGLPVIAANNGALPEIITDGHDGFLFYPQVVGSLAEALHRLINSEEEEISTNARETYESRFSADINLIALSEIYNEARRSNTSGVTS